MHTDSVNELIKCLDQLAEHPGWARKFVPPGHELSYISGVGLGVRFGLDIAKHPEQERELRHKAAADLGRLLDRHPHDQMLERGFSADAVLSELAWLEVEFIRLASKL
jgi:hypothetical protein